MIESVFDVDYIRSLVREEEEENPDFLYELRYESVGNPVEFQETTVSGNWVFVVVDNQCDIEYDSYGYGYNNDAFIVLSVSDGKDTALYKIPGAYQSMEGWDWDFRRISRVEKREKVVTSYEWGTV